MALAQDNLVLPIQTSRLILRDFVPDDWRAVQEYAADPEVIRFMPWGPNTQQQSQEFVQSKIAEQTAMPRIRHELAVILKQSGNMIGACGLTLSSNRKQGALGYIFNRKHWGNGYCTEAVEAMMRAGFEQLRLHRIKAECDAQNVASARVMEKNAMRREGHMIEDDLLRDHWRDSFLYAILDREWVAVKGTVS